MSSTKLKIFLFWGSFEPNQYFPTESLKRFSFSPQSGLADLIKNMVGDRPHLVIEAPDEATALKRGVELQRLVTYKKSGLTCYHLKGPAAAWQPLPYPHSVLHPPIKPPEPILSQVPAGTTYSAASRSVTARPSNPAKKTIEREPHKPNPPTTQQKAADPRTQPDVKAEVTGLPPRDQRFFLITTGHDPELFDGRNYLSISVLPIAQDELAAALEQVQDQPHLVLSANDKKHAARLALASGYLSNYLQAPAEFADRTNYNQTGYGLNPTSWQNHEGSKSITPIMHPPYPRPMRALLVTADIIPTDLADYRRLRTVALALDTK